MVRGVSCAPSALSVHGIGARLLARFSQLDTMIMSKWLGMRSRGPKVCTKTAVSPRLRQEDVLVGQHLAFGRDARWQLGRQFPVQLGQQNPVIPLWCSGAKSAVDFEPDWFAGFSV